MNDVSVIAYFAGDPSLTYQLTQWLEVLEVLDEVQPVGLVVRDPESAALIAARTDLPLFTAGTFADFSELYAELDAKVVLYCNNPASTSSPSSTPGCCTSTSTTARATAVHGEQQRQAYDRVSSRAAPPSSAT